ncbi:MAG: cation transporter [Roseibacillus sp.]
MKTLLCLFLPLLTTTLTLAEGKKTPATPAGDGATIKKKSCPLCKLPGRAALFAGAARPCPTDCTKLCCKGTEVVFVVKGVTDAAGVRKITGALAGLEGVQIENVSHESGRAVLRHAPDKITRTQLREIIIGCGYQVTGEQAAFSLEGLTTEKLAAAVESAIRAAPGVTGIETVCHKSGRAIVVFDPVRTTPRKIAAAINATPCKVVIP